MLGKSSSRGHLGRFSTRQTSNLLRSPSPCQAFDTSLGPHVPIQAPHRLSGTSLTAAPRETANNASADDVWGLFGRLAKGFYSGKNRVILVELEVGWNPPDLRWVTGSLARSTNHCCWNRCAKHEPSCHTFCSSFAWTTLMSPIKLWPLWRGSALLSMGHLHQVLCCFDILFLCFFGSCVILVVPIQDGVDLGRSQPTWKTFVRKPVVTEKRKDKSWSPLIHSLCHA